LSAGSTVVGTRTKRRWRQIAPPDGLRLGAVQHDVKAMHRADAVDVTNVDLD
jgi:hypothetical protein